MAGTAAILKSSTQQSPARFRHFFGRLCEQDNFFLIQSQCKNKANNLSFLFQGTWYSRVYVKYRIILGLLSGRGCVGPPKGCSRHSKLCGTDWDYIKKPENSITIVTENRKITCSTDSPRAVSGCCQRSSHGEGTCRPPEPSESRHFVCRESKQCRRVYQPVASLSRWSKRPIFSNCLGEKVPVRWINLHCTSEPVNSS
jgi:hypothetical protein